MLRYYIRREYTFEAAHRLLGLSPDHKCSRIHGHSYRLSVEVSARHLDDRGMVEDFEELDGFVKPLVADLDHRLLLSPRDPLANSKDSDLRVLGYNPTAENIAKMFWEVLVDVVAHGTIEEADVRLETVTVYETERGSATVRRATT